ncbi:caspase family protein [bacterium]|nr:caspase family protein [bacterium]
MKKLFGLITICSVLAMPVWAAKPVPVNVTNPANHPLPVTDIHLVKKTILPLEVGEVKDRPTTPPGQDKDKNNGPSEGAATGILGDSASGERYAIIIGICDYPGEKNDICKSDGDSLNMYKALTTLYGYDPDNIYLFKDYGGTYFEEDTTDDIPTITARRPTRENILNAISELKNKATSSEDEIVFFFSGHGADGIAQDEDNESRDEGIVVHNNDSTGIDYIWDGELKTAFTGFATTRIAFVFDTCLAGGMDDLADTGRVISMATSENQVAYVYTKEGDDVDGDGQPDGEGVFTHYFVKEGMLKGLANIHDYDGDSTLYEPEQVTTEEAFDYAKEKIENSSYKRQKPVISDNFTNDLLL